MELPKYRQIKLARTVGKNIQAVVSTTIYTDGIGYQSCLFLLFSDGTCHGIICEDEESSEEPVAV
jgi:hypothetical protein